MTGIENMQRLMEEQGRRDVSISESLHLYQEEMMRRMENAGGLEMPLSATEVMMAASNTPQTRLTAASFENPFAPHHYAMNDDNVPVRGPDPSIWNDVEASPEPDLGPWTGASAAVNRGEPVPTASPMDQPDPWIRSVTRNAISGNKTYVIVDESEMNAQIKNLLKAARGAKVEGARRSAPNKVLLAGQVVKFVHRFADVPNDSLCEDITTLF